MENAVVTKGIVASLLFVFGFIYNSVGVFFIVLVLTMTIDYITGVVAALVKGEASSKKGLIGIAKKVGCVALVLTAILLDIAIFHAVSQFGIKLPVDGIFGILTTGWLFANEGISVVENLGRMGISLPPFLLKGFHIFKDTMEKGEGGKNENN